MKPTFTIQNVLRMILDDLKGSHMFSDVFIIFSVFSGCFPKKKQLKVPEFCRSDVGYLWLFLSPRGSIVLQGVLKRIEFYRIEHLLIGYPPAIGSSNMSLFICCFLFVSY